MKEKEKICSYCKKKKPLSEFYKDKSRLDNASRACKECVREYSKEYSLKNENRKEYLRKYAKNYASTEAGKMKIQTRVETRNAVKNGELIKKPCEICGNIKSEAHHKDYKKPLDIIWLCDLHHQQLHRGIITNTIIKNDE